MHLVAGYIGSNLWKLGSNNTIFTHENNRHKINDM